MKKTDVTRIPDNLIDIIGNEWMLITAGTPEKFNTMTANWGGTGYLWNRPVAFIFVRPERYTYEFVERETGFTLSFLGGAGREAYKICGSRSGREIDKIAATGLTPLLTEEGGIGFAESRLTLACRKLYAAPIEASHFLEPGIYEKWYGARGGDHKMYIAEILAAYTASPQQTSES